MRLYLVDENGSAVSAEIDAAVQRSYRWVLRDFPQIDPAMIANWAEEVALKMQCRKTPILSPSRYAYAALKGKVHDWMRSFPAKEQFVGLGHDLEIVGGTNASFQKAVDNKILFEELKAALNERDRVILVLLLQDKTSPAAIAKALGISYSAAAKAIERVKKRIASTLNSARKIDGTGHDSPQFCETKG